MYRFRTLGSFILGLFLLVALPMRAQEEVVDNKIPEKESAIPISQISAESEKVLKTLESEFRPAIEKHLLQETWPVIDSLRAQMTEVERLTNSAISQNFPADLIESFMVKWDDLIADIEQPLNNITAYSESLEAIKIRITETKSRWQATGAILENEEVESGEAIARVTYVLQRISEFEEQLTDSLNIALSEQNLLTDLRLDASKQREIQNAHLRAELGSLLTEKEAFIWKAHFQEDSLRYTRASKDFYYSYNLAEADRFLKDNSEIFYYLLVIFIVLLLLLYLMIARLQSLEDFEISVSLIGQGIFKRPIFTALFLTSICAIPFLIDSPIFVAVSMVMVILLSFIVLIPVTITREFRSEAYVFTFLYMLFIGRDLFPTDAGTHRINELFLSVGLLAFMIWFRRKQKKIGQEYLVTSLWFKLITLITPLFLFGLVVAVLSNIIGFIHLSYLITDTVVRSYYIAIVFGIVYSTFTAVFTLALHTPLASQLKLVIRYRELIIKRLKGVFQFLFILFWLRFTLDSLHLLVPSLDLLDQILSFGLKLEDFEITLGNFVNFILIIVAAWLISNFIRLLLQDEILSRFDMPKGVPMAIASLSYYTLFVIGVVLAMLGLGFDITHLSVLAGALGIGIGFGLQNVVNNFISGLILIFERPITVGDIVNLQTIEGQVISIGIRASKVAQYDGSVLIVPNADLISHQVVNFTLTDDKRRFVLPINTNTDADPALVLQLMNEAANSIPEVMADPPAKSYFTGTEDQSRVFKLYYWVSGRMFLQAKSDVTVAVHKLLEQNGIEVKAQREVKLSGER